MAWLGTWAKRVKLSIDHDDIDSTLTWFPVLVHISSSCGINSEDLTCVFDELESDDNRKKIAVTEDDETTQLYVEIEKWDDANEEAYLWVSKTGWEIANDADTDLYLYYDSNQDDNTTYVKDVNPSVWDSNFLRVDHCRVGADENITEFNTATYDSNPLIVDIGSDTILLHYTQCATHDSGAGYIYEKRYTISIDTWGASSLVLDPTVGSGGESHMLFGLAGGLIDGHFIHFFGKYAGSGGATTMHWIRSYDADCDSWVPSPTVFTGSGLDDCTSGGEFQDASHGWYEFVVEIDGTGTPDTFKWSNDGGNSWEDTEIAITGSPQTLENGATVTFGATTGHTSGDKWEFSNVYTYTHSTIPFRCTPFGPICETSTSTTYLQTFYVYQNEIGDRNASCHALRSTDNGVTWSYFSEIVGTHAGGGDPEFSELSAAYIGDSKIVCHIRNNCKNAVYQTTSDDNGATWSDDPPLKSSLGLDSFTQGCAYPWLYYDSTNDCLVSLYQDRWSVGTQWMMMARCDAATAYGDRTKWNGQYLETARLGGGSVLNLEGNKYLIVYSNEKLDSDADIRYGFHYLKDSTANGFDGRFLGSMTTGDLVESDIGNGIEFDGSNDYIRITDNALMSAMTGGFTLELMMKAPLANEWQQLFLKRDGFNDAELSLITYSMAADKRFQGVVYDWSEISYRGRSDTASTLHDDSWHTATAVYEGGTSSSNIKLYQDGAAVDDTDVEDGAFTAIEDTAEDMIIGGPITVATVQYFAGIMDEIRISNTGRSAAWVKATYETERDNLLDWGSEEVGGAWELSISDGLKAGDTPASAMVASLSVTEGLKGGDTPSSIGMLSLSDGVSLGEVLAILSSLNLTDGTVLSDTGLPYVLSSLSLTDGLKLSDAVILNLLTIIYNLTLADSAKFSDSESQAMTASLSLTDGVKFGEVLSRLSTISVSITDGVTFSETNLAELTGVGFYLYLADGLKLADTPLTSFLASLTLSDGTKLGDSELPSMVASILETDGIKLSDALTIEGLIYLLTLSDGIKVSDTEALSAAMEVVLSDGTKFGDASAMSFLSDMILSLVLKLYGRDLITKLHDRSLVIKTRTERST